MVGRKGSIGTVNWVQENFVPIDTTYYVVPVDSKIGLRWAYHFLAREELSRLNRATGIPGLNRDDVYSLQRQIPPLLEQRAIAAVLDSIDDAIEGAGAVIAATEQLRDSLLHDLLTRGLPGQHTEWRDVPGLGTIPADWEVVRLGDVAASITSGSSRLLKKGVHVRNMRSRPLRPWSYWGKPEDIVPFPRDFQPLRFCGPAFWGAPGTGSPLSGHAIRASVVAVA